MNKTLLLEFCSNSIYNSKEEINVHVYVYYPFETERNQHIV
jgi:hypothetical protein